VSRHGPGRRARGRRGDQDANANNTAWLEELEKAAAEQDDEEEWASKLRRRRRPRQDPDPPWADAAEPPAPSAPDRPGRAPELPRAPVAHDLSPYPPLGDEPAAPPPPPARPAPDPGPTREPDYPWLGMEPEPDTGSGGGWGTDWAAEGSPSGDATADWTPADPASKAAGEPATDWSTWAPDAGASGYERYDLGEPDWRPTGPDTDTGAWSPVDPVGREPDYPALFGELNRRSAAQREALWDSPPAPEPYEDPGPAEPPAPAWPFEETTGTWEPSDRSFIWPAEELPATTGDWEPSTPSWLDEPAAKPPIWPPAAGAATPGDPASAAPGVGAAPDDWAAGIQSGVPPAAGGLGERESDPAAGMWRPDEAVEAEPAVPLDANGRPPASSVADRVRMAEPADSWELYERPRSTWPRVVAVISWIVLLMVVCWFYVFPWLEQVLPENF
jgi:hypothetical protein